MRHIGHLCDQISSAPGFVSYSSIPTHFVYHVGLACPLRGSNELIVMTGTVQLLYLSNAFQDFLNMFVAVRHCYATS